MLLFSLHILSYNIHFKHWEIFLITRQLENTVIMKSCFSDIFKDCYFRGILLHVTPEQELDNKTSYLIGHVPDTVKEACFVTEGEWVKSGENVGLGLRTEVHRLDLWNLSSWQWSRSTQLPSHMRAAWWLKAGLTVLVQSSSRECGFMFFLWAVVKSWTIGPRINAGKVDYDLLQTLELAETYSSSQ